MNDAIRRGPIGPVALSVYAVLVVPFAVGTVDNSLMTPLALPGYLLFVVGTAIGNALAPRFELWVYWVPLLVGCYVLAASIGVAYELARGQRPA